jgi:MFS superfamily sulfate permease-like transporter
VFLIGVELVDLAGMHRILAVRKNEFIVATLTAAAVVAIGVEQAVILAIVASLVDHVRRGYAPKDAVLVPDGSGHIRYERPDPGTRTLEGLVIYRFAASLYYANATHFVQEVQRLTADEGAPVRWLCIDASAIADIDYSGSETLRELAGSLRERHTRLVLTNVAPDVRSELDRYGLTAVLGHDALYDTTVDVLTAYVSSPPDAPSA